MDHRRRQHRHCITAYGIVDAIELDTDVAGIVDVAGDVLELVYGDRQLQPRNGQQREAYGSAPMVSIRQVVVFSEHLPPAATSLPEL